MGCLHLSDSLFYATKYSKDRYTGITKLLQIINNRTYFLVENLYIQRINHNFALFLMK